MTDTVRRLCCALVVPFSPILIDYELDLQAVRAPETCQGVLHEAYHSIRVSEPISFKTGIDVLVHKPSV